jgi:hypothetical protein
MTARKSIGCDHPNSPVPNITAMAALAELASAYSPDYLLAARDRGDEPAEE